MLIWFISVTLVSRDVICFQRQECSNTNSTYHGYESPSRALTPDRLTLLWSCFSSFGRCKTSKITAIAAAHAALFRHHRAFSRSFRTTKGVTVLTLLE